MSTSTAAGTASRVLSEGYGAGAWHGPDMKAALADVTSSVAFWRPAEGRHNIAEIALHHAYYTRVVRTKISGSTEEPFVLDGEDWFVIEDESRLSWPTILSTVEAEHASLASLVSGIEAGKPRSSLAEPERFDLALGIACHAVYHAGQIQLIKRLREQA